MEATNSAWVQLYDEKSNAPYYYNTETWTVSWDPPSDMAYDDFNEAESQRQALDDYYRQLDGEIEQKSGDNSYQSDWIEQYDESSQSVYFYNQATGESVWDRPAELAVTQSAEYSADQTYSADIPQVGDMYDGEYFQNDDYQGQYYTENGEYDYNADPAYWTANTDEASGQVYYYNSATQATQWDIPACFEQQVDDTLVDSYSEESGSSSPLVTHSRKSTIRVTNSNSHIPFENGVQTNDVTVQRLSIRKTPLVSVTKHSKRHSISGPMNGKLSFLDTNTSSTISHVEASISTQRKSVTPQYFPKNNVSNLLKYSKIHEYANTSDDPSKGTETVKNKSTISGTSHNESVANILPLADMTEEEIDLPISPLKTVDLAKISTMSSIESICNALKGASIVEYIIIFRSKSNRVINEPRQSLTWSPEEISRPLLALKSNEEAILSKKCYKLILSFMEGVHSDDAMPTSPKSSALSLMNPTQITRKPLDFAMLLITTINTACVSNASQDNMIIDEIYCQLCKQLINNPSVLSSVRGWQLMQLFLATIIPSKNCLINILSFISHSFYKLAKESIKSRSSSSLGSISSLISYLLGNDNQYLNNQYDVFNRDDPLHKAIAAAFVYSLKLVSYINEVSEKSKTNDDSFLTKPCRNHLPSIAEIQALWGFTSINVVVYTLSPKFVTIPIDSWTTVGKLRKDALSCLDILPNATTLRSDKSFDVPYETHENKLQHLTSHLETNLISSFALFECSGNSHVFLPYEERVLDIMAGWNVESWSLQNAINSQSKKPSKSYSTQKKLLLKIRYYLEIPSTVPSLSSSCREMYYYQSMIDVLNLKYPITENDAIFLAAYHLYISHVSKGDDSSSLRHEFDKKKSNNSKESGPDYLSSNHINQSYTQNKSSSQLSQILNTIKASFERLLSSNVSISDAQDLYLAVVCSWKLYGSTVFAVESRTELGTPSQLLLAIGRDGVTVVSLDSKTYIFSCCYDDMISWGFTDRFYIIVAGNKSKSLRHYFKTALGNEIHELMQIFTDAHKIRRKTAIEDESLLKPVVFDKSIFSVTNKPLL